MSRALQVALGVVTAFGGFLEAGSIATSAQAGSEFGYRLLWVLALGTLCLVFLVEMSGRLAAVSHHTIAAAVRERFGFAFYLLPLVGMVLVGVLTLVAELGAICIALQFATGIAFQWWALPVTFAVWALLWAGNFDVIENGVSLLGLLTVVFIVAALREQPPLRDIAAGLVPSLAPHDGGRFWFLAVSILGATLTPYLFYFYSSGAVEEHWDERMLTTNRMVASVGMGFGAVLAAAVLVVSATVFGPRGIRLESYDQLALLLTDSLGRWGFALFVAALAIACLGAALEITLALAYMVAQGFGWSWGENLGHQEAARFTATYTVALVLAAIPVALGLDPMRVTNVAMVLNGAALPLAVMPFLVLMNDRDYVGVHANGRLANVVVLVVTVLACVLAIVSLPLELVGG
ncbi:MAG TPA: divalent metal cation transporter [Methylomirabilota bacterium]|nr:divalent metal cation transporter [Methylomirabilota bacterium]